MTCDSVPTVTTSASENSPAKEKSSTAKKKRRMQEEDEGNNVASTVFRQYFYCPYAKNFWSKQWKSLLLTVLMPKTCFSLLDVHSSIHPCCYDLILLHDVPLKIEKGCCPFIVFIANKFRFELSSILLFLSICCAQFVNIVFDPHLYLIRFR